MTPMERTGRTIYDLETPAVLIDVKRVQQNIERYQSIANRGKVELWPHGKTSKLPFVWDMQREAGATGLTVATVREAEVAMAHGHTNIFIAYPHVDPKSLKRIQALAQIGQVTLMVSSRDGASIVYNFFHANPPYPKILLAIDTGLHREGMPARNLKTIKFIEELQSAFKNDFRGITTHEGHSYKTRRHQTVKSIGLAVRKKMSDIQKRCKEQGHPIDTIAIGATPTFAFFENDQRHKVTEAHPGNYVFLDATALDTIAKPEDCALTVLTRVIDSRVLQNKDRMLYVNAGSKTLSKEQRPHGEGGSLSYGRVYDDLLATRLLEDVNIRSLSEEIGWIEVKGDRENPIFKIESMVRLLVQHSCPVMSCNTRVWLVEGEKVIEPMDIPARGYEHYRGQRKVA